MSLRQNFGKRKIIRAAFLTCCMLTYMMVIGQFVSEVSLYLFLVFICSCILVDILAVKVMKTRFLSRFFYEEVKND